MNTMPNSSDDSDADDLHQRPFFSVGYEQVATTNQDVDWDAPNWQDNPEQYLKCVRAEASKLPKVTCARGLLPSSSDNFKIGHQLTEKTNTPEYVRRLNDLNKLTQKSVGSDSLIIGEAGVSEKPDLGSTNADIRSTNAEPTEKWKLEAIKFFTSVKLDVEKYLEAVAYSDIPIEVGPTTPAEWRGYVRNNMPSWSILYDTVRACALLEALAEKTDESHTDVSHKPLLTVEELRWIFASLVVLDSLQALDANTSFNLQRIKRHCIWQSKLLPQDSDNTQKQNYEALQSIITVICDYFGQK